jgi:hypothetical protein
LSAARGLERADADRTAAASLRRRLRGCIAVLALWALARAETPHLEAMQTLHDLDYTRLVNWSDYERRLTLAGAGLEILPPAILAAAALLRDQGADRYRLAPQIAADGFLLQRISEVTWPAQMDPQAKFVLRLESEPEVCMTVARNGGVALDRCD